MAERVLLAMSGGVDSSVAAVLLKEAGHDVVGLFMNFFAGEAKRRENSRSCCAVEDAADARRVAARLDIPFYSADLSDAFQGIRDNFVSEYSSGRTPVPCTLCNRDVKFGQLLDYADSIGAHRVATGHYARVEKDDRGVTSLLRARHHEKDQTYFLWPLSKAGLDRAMFPVGTLSKDEVRAVAQDNDLLVANKPESQDLCFVPDGDYVGYLREQAGIAPREGNILDEAGAVVGTHQGIEGFTVGQRRGLGVALGEPHYVVNLDAETNTVVLGPRSSLEVNSLIATGASWPGGAAPAGPFEASVRVRHAPTTYEATINPLDGDSFEVRFHDPVAGVAPGQAAVCYVGERVACGGWISCGTARST